MEEALTAHLLAHAGLAALVGIRVTWDERPQAGALPAVTLQVIDGAPEYSDEGHAGLSGTRVQIDCWAADATNVSGSSTAKLVARQVLAALPVGFSKDGVEFQGAFPESGRDFPPEIGPGGIKFYRRSLDFEIWHTG